MASLLRFINVGSSMSLRSCSRIGSVLSAQGMCTMGSTFVVSVLEYMLLGSTLSIRSTMRVPGAVSALSYFQLASSQSLRGLQDIRTLSQLSFAQFSSALSLRSAIGLGSVSSIFCEAKL